MLDVVLHEDTVQIRKGPAAINLALVRRVAEALIRRDTTVKASKPKRMRRALLNDAYRIHLLTLANP